MPVYEADFLPEVLENTINCTVTRNSPYFANDFSVPALPRDRRARTRKADVPPNVCSRCANVVTRHTRTVGCDGHLKTEKGSAVYFTYKNDKSVTPEKYSSKAKAFIQPAPSPQKRKHISSPNRSGT